MMKRIVLALLLCATLVAAGGGAAPALAQGGCQPVDPRAAAQSGQIAPLSNFLGSIRQATGGGTPIGSQVCQMGGRLVYRVQVMVGGRQMTINIDAATGAPVN
jgi:hypothetical protein